MIRTHLLCAVFFLAALNCQPVHASDESSASDIVSRPEQLKFPPLNYEPPDASKYRVALKTGPVAYLLPDRALPLVNISITVRVGEYLEPSDKIGLAELTGYLLSHGGTQKLTAEQMDERTAFLAADLHSMVGPYEGSVGLNLLSKDLDEGLQMLRDILTTPRFQDDKIALRKQQMIQAMKERNDDSSGIESREYGILALGEDFWANRFSTKDSVDGITRADIEAFHKKWFHPGNFVVAVSGDFDPTEMQARLEKLFGDWPFKGETPLPIPNNVHVAAPGIYLAEKDVNQGRVTILLPGVQRDNPDYFALQIMNDILGGGGFTSHIMNSVRSDEGLAYSAGSSFRGGTYYPTPFLARFQSKSRTVSYAASIVIKEIKKMTEKPPTAEELAIAKRSYILRFPEIFATKQKTGDIFAAEEFTGRAAKNPDYFKNYREKIKAVTADEVLRVARKYLDPDQVALLIVGNTKEISTLLPEHPVELKSLSSGPIIKLPQRDPLTMKPINPKEKPAPLP